MMGPFDHDLAEFSQAKKMDAGRLPSSNMTPGFIAQCNANDMGLKGSTLGNDDMMAFIGEGYWRQFPTPNFLATLSARLESKLT